MSTMAPLISVAQLAAMIAEPDVMVLDASIAPVGNMALPPQRWPSHCLPGAKRFDIEAEFGLQTSTLPHTMPSAEQFTEQAQRLGINRQTRVVVYDDQGIFSSARAWWMFKAMGHDLVSVLDGGLPAWLAEQLPVASAESETAQRGNFVANYRDGYFCGKQQVLAALGDSGSALIDARASARFYGKVAEPRAGLRSGHMPGAKNLPFGELLVQGKMKDKAQLMEYFQPLASPKQPVIFSCGSGVTACVLALAADICAYPHISVYDGSWSEWGQDLTLPVSID